MKRILMVALACASASGGTALGADYEGLTLGAGVHYTEGNYGTPVSTEITSLALTGRYDAERWIFKATVPWLSVSGSPGVVPGIGRVRGPVVAERSQSGLGDVVLSATHKTYYDTAQQVGLDLTGRIKLATADEAEGLGTGEHDVGFQADAFKSFGRITGFVGLGYTIFGDSPAFPLRNVFNATFGATYRLNERDSAGIAYDRRDAVARGADDLSELTAFWSHQLDRAWKSQAYFLLGLEDGSPDWGAGLSLAYAF
jgi:hypothetical protein